MDSRWLNYYKTTIIAGVFGIIVSLFGITWISIFLSFLKLDPLTIDIFSKKGEILVEHNVTAIISAEVAEDFLITSLAMHFIWFQVSIALVLANKWNVASVLWIWLITSCSIFLTDLIGTVFSAVVLFIALSRMAIHIHTVSLYAMMFIAISKVGFLFHIPLGFLTYFVRQRIKEMNQKLLPAWPSVTLPIATVESQIAGSSKTPTDMNDQCITNNASSKQTNVAYISTIENYDESIYSGNYSMASTIPDYEPIKYTNNESPTNSTSRSAVMEYIPQTFGRDIPTTTL